ncbi:MAG TPA: hypothetical protein VHI99_30570 [Vicinamibacterales bacterium]|jgi:hypothetical protein|nr:hypothetical protein [Vicinamibacterales bacterium]
MHRSVFAPAVALLFCAVTVSTVFAQAKPAAQPQTPAPAAPAKFVPPVKGVATIEVMRGQSKRVGKEIITPLKIKNTSTGSISLLKIDELWYNKKRDMVTAGDFRYKKPFLPGEIIDVEIRSPVVGEPDVSQLTFTHANGKVEFKPVKKM